MLRLISDFWIRVVYVRDVPVITMATMNPPTSRARHDSHHVKPRVMNEDTTAHVPGLSRSDAQSNKYRPSAPNPCMNSFERRTSEERPGGPSSILGRTRIHICESNIGHATENRDSPLLLHTSSGAIQLSSRGSFQAATVVVRALRVSPIPMLK